MSTKPMTTVKKIRKAVKKMKQVVNLTTELATVKTTRELTTTPQAVSLTASTVTNATVQNNDENVTAEILEIKTTITEQNATDEKLATKPVTEKLETETPTVSEIITISEITTVTEPSTTTTTVKTARTRQARPFVFMGGS
uniref:Uncharacterized protein n=1 Tax=Heliothis virescens TaxID=7102 RepID=A0A2A4J349_HELVI